MRRLHQVGCSSSKHVPRLYYVSWRVPIWGGPLQMGELAHMLPAAQARLSGCSD